MATEHCRRTAFLCVYVRDTGIGFILLFHGNLLLLFTSDYNNVRPRPWSFTWISCQISSGLLCMRTTPGIMPHSRYPPTSSQVPTYYNIISDENTIDLITGNMLNGRSFQRNDNICFFMITIIFLFLCFRIGFCPKS